MPRKRKRKRKLIPPTKKSSLPRQQAIIHAIKCSNDVAWLTELLGVVKDRIPKAQQARQDRLKALNWQHIREHCPEGSIVIPTLEGMRSLQVRKPYKVLKIRKIKQEIAIVRLDSLGRSVPCINLDAEGIALAGIRSVNSLSEKEQEQYEEVMLEHGLDMIFKGDADA